MRNALLNGMHRGLQAWKSNWFWLRWPVAAALLGWLLFSNRQVLYRLAGQRVDWGDLLAAFVLAAGALGLTFVRWHLLVWAQNFPFTLRDALRIGFIGYAFNYVAPGAAGGDLVKAWLVAREQQSRRTVAAGTVLLDRLLGLLSLFVVGAVASLFQPPGILEHRLMQGAVAVFWIGSAAGLLGSVLLLHPSVPRARWVNRLVRLKYVGRFFGEMINALLLYQSKRRVVAAAVLIGIAGHFGMLSCFYFCARALPLGNAAPGYWTHLLLIPGAELIGVAIPTPGGVGALEGAVQYSYGIANTAAGSPVTRDVALAAGLLTGLAFRGISVVLAALGAGYYLTARGKFGRIPASELSTGTHTDASSGPAAGTEPSPPAAGEQQRAREVDD